MVLFFSFVLAKKDFWQKSISKEIYKEQTKVQEYSRMTLLHGRIRWSGLQIDWHMDRTSNILYVVHDGREIKYAIVTENSVDDNSENQKNNFWFF